MSLLNDPVFKIVAQCASKCVIATAMSGKFSDHAATLTMIFITASELAEQYAEPLPKVLVAMGVPEPAVELLKKKTDGGIPLAEALMRFNSLDHP